MSNLMRLPHEISLWEDVLTVVDNDGNEYEGFIPSNEVTVVAQYYKEKRLCVISSDKMESPAYAVDPQLVRKTDGTNTLTFSIYAKIYDEETGEFIDNPFVQYLTNERKVKLKYYPNGKMKWLDFVIKKIDENSENYKFTYTATDLFINELSKSGYGLEYNIELENNQGTIDELARDVLHGTDWAVGADSEKLQQTVTEALYAITLTKKLTAKDIFNPEKTIEIDEKETIYVYYSVIENKTYDYFQFIYSTNGYIQDENGVVYNSGNYYAELDENNLPYDKPVYFNDFRAERYVRSPKMIYDEVIGKYVSVYNNGTVRGYSESEYISPALVNNFITNGAHIISNSGWLQQKAGSVKVEMLPTYKETTYYEPGRLHCIEFEKSDTNTYLLNTGLSDNASKIGSIAKGDSFVFRIKGGAPTTKDNITTGTSAVNISFNVEIATYKFDNNGLIEKGETLAYRTTSAKGEWCYIDDLKISRAFSVEELTDLTTKRFGIFISVNGEDGTYYIHEVEFFKRVEDQNGYIILPNGQTMRNGEISDTVPVSYVDTTYYYYTPNDEATDISEIKYLYIGKRALDTYQPDYVADFEKIRSINAKETNRFNLLQTLSETFECWCRFDVLHKANGEIALVRDMAQDIVDASTDGEVQKIYNGYGPTVPEEKQIDANLIKTVEDGYRQQKFVTFHKRIGQKKPIGFTYGINLKSINRSLDSNDIATKLIVKSNNNQYANMGSCNIARANMNPSSENFVLDFSHYIRQGLLNYENVQRDLYSEDQTQGWLGLFTKLKANNIERDKLITKQSSLAKEYSKFKSEDESSKLLLAGAQEELAAQKNYYCDLTSFEYGDIEKEISKLEAQLLNPPEGETKETLEEKIESLKGWLKNTKVIATATNIEQLKEETKQHTENRDAAEAQLLSIEEQLASLEKSLENLKNLNRAELDKFEQKYSRFLQEASWISEDYTDDNLYYIDAESTLHKSAQPKVSYTINIVELSALEDYEAYNFDLGDITYVQDPDFFGWEIKDGAKTPYKEEVVITESAIYFNSPEKNTLKAQNYRDSFEDLFQRMTATTQQLQFYGGSYDRAADVVDTNGNIMPKSLSEAFANNAYVLSNIANQSVKWDEYGITTTDTTDPTDIVRITSGGIYLTEDGGRNWTTGISASGINAKTITTGQLDTGAVTIMSGDQTAFRWDESGINAFKESENGERSSKTYVRFDEHGIYGIDGQANFDPKEEGENKKTGIDKINEEAKFALTWDGFVLNSSDKTDSTAKVKISDTDDIQILDKNKKERLKIGRLDGQNSVGMRITTTDVSKTVAIGDTGYVDGGIDGHGKLIMRAGTAPKDGKDEGEFRLFEDGFLYAKTAQIGGYMKPSDLREARINIQHYSDNSEGYVLLTCGSTINSDEIDEIEWSGAATGKTSSIELKYENFETPIGSNLIDVSVSAKLNGEEFSDTLTFEASLIYIMLLKYGTSSSAQDQPEEWMDSIPEELEPGTYLWTKSIKRDVSGLETEVGTLSVSYIGSDAKSQFTSIVFTRTESNTSPATPEGGTYSEPIPHDPNGQVEWQDGIPQDGNNQLPFIWSSQAVFKTETDFVANWSAPVLMRDVSGKFDVQYSNETEQPANPTDAPEKWYDASLTGADLTNAIWMATRSSEDGGANWSVWTITRIKGEDGVAAQDLNLKADSYVFVQDKDGNITPSQINLTAAAYNLSGGVIAWSGVEQEDIDGVTNTAILSYNANDYVNGSGHTVSVTYTDIETGQVTFTDSITILLVKDGSDAISASLTNPTMTFAEGAMSTETTGAIVYYGSTPINYATGGNTGWYYTIACKGAASIKNGIISINNPGETTTFEAIIVVYKDGNVYRTQTLVINCLVTESPYTIELSNDSATIGVDENGSYDSKSLELVTQTSVTVHKGATDITEECSFAWTTEGGTLAEKEGSSNFFTGLSTGSTTAMATVVVTLKDSGLIIGTKTLKVATIEAGAAVSYKLNITPNTVNLTSVESKVVTLEVLKITGGSVETLSSGYSIYIGTTKLGAITGYGVSADTTFDLYIGDNKWDSETVSVVHDGNDSTVPGPQGYSGATITLYKRSASTPTGTNAKPSGSLTYTFSTKTLTGSFNNWSTSVPTGSNPCYAIYAYATSNTDTDIIATTEWSTPVAIEGKAGENGINTAVVFLYKRASSKPSGPTGTLTYDFASGALSAAYASYFNNWEQTMPAANGNPCYFIQNVVAGTGATATIAKTDWSDPQIYVKDGTDGHTIQTVSAYYLTSSFGTPSSKPGKDNTITNLPDGWTSSPSDLSSTNKYQYVSQCTVTDGVYGTWTNPVLYARYGSDGKNGSDATVTALNVFSVLTSDGQKFGCFGNDGNSLYINANFINTGILRVGDTNSEIFFADINNKLVGIGGFSVGKINLTGQKKEAIYYGLVASSNGLTNDVNFDSMLICPKGLLYSKEFAGQSDLIWKMIIGTKFGITNTGALYASDVHLSGNITNTTTDASGNIQTVKLKEGYMECQQTINNKTYKRIVSGPCDLYTIDGNTTGFTVGYNTALTNTAIVGLGLTYIRFTSNGAQLFGTWKGTSSQAIASDRSKKNTIRVLEGSYETLYDNLIPVTYKYNDGLSGRTHTGFIAQEVAQALAIAGISTKDFAGYIVANEINSETGEEEEVCYLRYEEFISLNTWQIQKLKPRITAAEQEIEKLKLEIEQLRAELNSIK